MNDNKKIPLNPINGRVLIQRDKQDLMTASGIYLAQSGGAEKPDTGVVLKVGISRIDENGKEIPIRVKEGQKVMFRKYAGDEIEYEGEKYYMLEEETIIATID